MSIVYSGWMRHVLPSIPGRFARLGEQVWGIEREGRSDLEVGAEAIERTTDYWRELGIDLSLRAAGVEQHYLDMVPERVLRYGPVGSVRPLTADSIADILTSVK
ncbi:MAG: iron-containing alcohol dehydrogenase [Austwickia sp.]|jgi:alcohol dehydrogenase YqhD (iron-dependent ADH family)|nr:iron-containing alcohol dehydrogenase [Austwickia sp.]MBK9102106.1 iron-containing alcohol dehydrogenase [Austwickia sp.]